MDPTIGLITGAIAAGAAAAFKDTAGQAVKDAYNGLKELIKGKFGKESELADAVAKLESKPDSGARRELLAEEVAAAEADKDEAVIRAAKALMELVQPKQAAAGKFNIQANNVQGVVQAEKIDTLTQNFSS
jgi:hypothetical protein